MYSWPDHARQSAIESAAVSGFPHWWVSWQRWIWSCEILKLCSYLMSCWCSGDIGSERVRQQRFGQQWLCLPIDSWSYCWWDRRWWAMDHGWTMWCYLMLIWWKTFVSLTNHSNRSWSFIFQGGCHILWRVPHILAALTLLAKVTEFTLNIFIFCWLYLCSYLYLFLYLYHFDFRPPARLPSGSDNVTLLLLIADPQVIIIAIIIIITTIINTVSIIIIVMSADSQLDPDSWSSFSLSTSPSSSSSSSSSSSPQFDHHHHHQIPGLRHEPSGLLGMIRRWDCDRYLSLSYRWLWWWWWWWWCDDGDDGDNGLNRGGSWEFSHPRRSSSSATLLTRHQRQLPRSRQGHHQYHQCRFWRLVNVIF